MVDMNLRVVLTAATGNFKSQLDNTMKGAGETLGKSASTTLERLFKGIGGAGGRVGGMMNAFPIGGAAGAAVAGVGAVIGILKMIHDRIDKMLDKMTESSGALKGARDMLDKMFSLTLKPMADVMTALMRPYLMLIMRRTRALLADIRADTGLMQRASAGDQDALTKIMGMTEEAMGDIAFITQKMNDVIRPIAGRLDGFKAGIDLVFNNFLTGISEEINGFAAGIASTMKPFPAWLETQIKQNPEELKALPTNIATAYKAALTSDVAMTNLTNLPIAFAEKAQGALGAIVASMDGVARWFAERTAQFYNTSSGSFTNSPSLGDIDIGALRSAGFSIERINAYIAQETERRRRAFGGN